MYKMLSQSHTASHIRYSPNYVPQKPSLCAYLCNTLANLIKYHPVHLHDPNRICNRDESVEDRARIAEHKIAAFPRAAACLDRRRRRDPPLPSQRAPGTCAPAAWHGWQALLGVQRRTPNADISLAKTPRPAQTPRSPSRRSPTAAPRGSASPTAAPLPPRRGRCASGVWDGGARPAAVGGIAARPTEEVAPAAASSLGSGSHRGDGARGDGWARRRAGDGGEHGRAAAAASAERAARWRRPVTGTFQGLVHPPDATVELQHPQRRHSIAPGTRPGRLPERRSLVPPLFRSHRPPSSGPRAPRQRSPAAQPRRRA